MTNKCGSTAGYQQHGTDGTPTCQPCKTAQAVWQRNYKKRLYLNRGPLTVDATGTHRRLQALARLGWPFRAVAAEFGISPARVSNILKSRRVRVETARKVLDLYDRWSMTVGPSNHARSRAIANEWPPPLDWESRDIDDPKALSHSQLADRIRAGRRRAQAAA